MNTVVASFLFTTVSYASCILLCSLGGQVAALTGRFNIGMEGMMLFGGFFSLYFTQATDSLVLGMLLGAASTGLLGLFMALVHLKLKVNIYVVGLAINTLGTGLTTFFVYLLSGTSTSVIYPAAPKLAGFKTPFIENIPYLNQILSGHNWLDYFAIVLCFFMFLLYRRTRFGRHLRAIGLGEDVAEARGIPVNRYIYISYFISGFFCGMAGAALSLPMGIFVGGMVGMTNGRGWLAMTVVILSGGNPLVALAASLLMGALSALGSAMQSAGNFPSDLVLMLPFVGALAASVLYSYTRKRRRRALGEE